MTGPRGPQGEGFPGPKVMGFHTLNSLSMFHLLINDEEISFH